MNSKDLGVLNEMPFYFWAKDEGEKYVWANRAVVEMAGEEVVGKTDHQLPWKASADALVAADKQVLETGKPLYIHEHALDFGQGTMTLSVCKFPGELDGKKCSFGVSFMVE